MYIPKKYQIEDLNEIKRFMKAHKFVTVVTFDGKKPIATHVPIIIKEEGNEIYISGHFAKGNQQLKTLEDNDNVLVIFQGPDGYISSTWYDEEEVPTWNYQSVHVYGSSKLITENELMEDLKVLLSNYEENKVNGATWDNLSNKTKMQIKGITGFEIKVNEVEAAYKLSQNRSYNEKENIISELKKTDQINDKVLAEVMENKYINE